MITKSQAEAIVRKWLGEHKPQRWDQGRLVEEMELAISHVDEHPWGWMFFYAAKKYLETGEIRYAVAGNCPVFVTRDDGAFHESLAGSGVPVEEHLTIFEARLAKQRA